MKRIILLLVLLSAVACQAAEESAPVVQAVPTVAEPVEIPTVAVVEEVLEVVEAEPQVEPTLENTPIPQSPVRSNLPILSEAKPWLNDTWINTPNNEPITLEQLEGKVVLLEFWTYS